jgi:16S rRNA (guanine966-N2)-methyltransferase
LRIVSGKYRGRTILPPKNLRARPTTDFAKEALFNILANRFDFEETDVLDLFSGTGSIGYEFASRGARSVEMVESNHTHHEFIRRTVQELKMDNVRAIKSDAFIYIERMSRQYDIIFADPPYELENIADIPGKIVASRLMKTETLVILEHGGNLDFSNEPFFFDHRKYGSVNFSFFRKA